MVSGNPNGFKGPHLEETKRKISKTFKSKGIAPINRFNKKSEEHKKKLSVSHKGQQSWNKGTNLSGMKGKKHKSETKVKMSLWIRTPEMRRKLRESSIKYIKKNSIGFKPRIGKNETQILNELEKLYGFKIIRQYPVAGYYVDGYIPELNLCIEVDEEYHKFDSKQDLERQKEIEFELKCKFLRITDKGLKLIKTPEHFLYSQQVFIFEK